MYEPASAAAWPWRAAGTGSGGFPCSVIRTESTKTVRQYPKSEHGALVPETLSVLASVKVISFPKVAASAAVTFRDFTSHCDAPADGVASTVTAFAALQMSCEYDATHQPPVKKKVLDERPQPEKENALDEHPQPEKENAAVPSAVEPVAS